MSAGISKVPASFALALLLPLLGGCRLFHDDGSESTSDEVVAKPAPARASVYLATVVQGHIFSRADQKATWVGEIQDQLAFAAGQLTGLGGVADLNRLEVTLGAAAPTPDGGLQVTYTAACPVGWEGAEAAPETVTLALPRGGDHAGRAAFFAAYGDRCADVPQADLAVATFWNHYRPSAQGCPLAGGDLDKAVATAVTLALSPLGGRGLAAAKDLLSGLRKGPPSPGAIAELGIRSGGSDRR
jgi:hypothetical protein